MKKNKHIFVWMGSWEWNDKEAICLFLWGSADRPIMRTVAQVLPKLPYSWEQTYSASTQ